MTARKASAALLATGLFAFSSAALATNGYFTHGVGTESKGMAGAGVASPADMGAISVATNPALGVFADDKWQIGLAVFSPMRSYEASFSQALANSEATGDPLLTFTLDQGKYDSNNEAFPIPYVAKNWKFSNGNALSLVFYGRGGMNTEWEGGQRAYFDPAPGNPFGPGTVNPPGVYGGGTAGVDLMQAFLSLNYAIKFGDSFAVGFGPVAAVQLFEATGVSNFAPYTKTFADAFLGNFQAAVTDCVIAGGKPEICQAQVQVPVQMQTAEGVTKLTNNGSDMSSGYGGAIGIWGGSERFSYGLAYQSKLSMSEFDDYADLFAEKGGFDIPSTLKGGVSFMAGATARINLDVEHIKYSEVDSISNKIGNLFSGCYTTQQVDPPESSGCLGGPNGGGFGWQDVTVYKAGVEWASNDSNTWRVGYSYGKQPIPSSEMIFNILAPGVMEQHMTVGWTSRRSNGNVLSMSLMYAPKKTIKGSSSFDPTQVITLEMQQLEFEIAYRF
jgi:long-chain fatty acid transport protein